MVISALERAYHEAGHAVIAVVIGTPLASVTLAEEGESGGHCTVAAGKHDVRFLLAGACAQWRWCQHRGVVCDERSWDWDLAPALKDLSPLVVMRWLLGTDELVGREWGAIRRVADGLVAQHRLTADQVRALMAPALPGVR